MSRALCTETWNRIIFCWTARGCWNWLILVCLKWGLTSLTRWRSLISRRKCLNLLWNWWLIIWEQPEWCLERRDNSQGLSKDLKRSCHSIRRVLLNSLRKSMKGSSWRTRSSKRVKDFLKNRWRRRRKRLISERRSPVWEWNQGVVLSQMSSESWGLRTLCRLRWSTKRVSLVLRWTFGPSEWLPTTS